MRSRAWLNGEEVTTRCFYADDRRGIVRLYKHSNGRAYVENGRVAVEERRGQVRIGRGDRA
jgi:hypothetical protein